MPYYLNLDSKNWVINQQWFKVINIMR